MSASLNSLAKKLNLYSDESYEHFRDVLTDNAINDSGLPLEGNEVKWFGNNCRLEGISNAQIDVSQNQEFLSEVISPWGWELSSLTLIHSRLLLHMQAEENMKINIIWTVEKTPTSDEYQDYSPIAVFFEGDGQGSYDKGLNFDPMQSGYWDEFLYDMGIGPDPFSDHFD